MSIISQNVDAVRDVYRRLHPRVDPSRSWVEEMQERTLRPTARVAASKLDGGCKEREMSRDDGLFKKDRDATQTRGVKPK